MSHFNIITGDTTVSDDSHNNDYLVGRDLSLTAQDTSYDTFSIFGLHNTLDHPVKRSDPADRSERHHQWFRSWHAYRAQQSEQHLARN